MPLQDINEATFVREAEKNLSASERTKAIANFAKLKTADERLAAFRELRKGSIISARSTKLGTVPDIR